MEKLLKAGEQTTSNTFLTGAILFANLNYAGLADYAVKAAIGGMIWMVFKLAGDYFSYRYFTKSKGENNDDLGKEDN